MPSRNEKIKICLVGASGRLGSSIQTVAKSDKYSSKIEITSLIHSKNSSQFLKDAKNSDLILDVSLPHVTAELIETLMKNKIKLPYIVGNTGWEVKKNEFLLLQKYARSAPLLLSANFSIAITLILKWIKEADLLLSQTGYGAVLHEIHHSKKRDAPSGTAKIILQQLKKTKTQVHSSRLSDVIGIHELHLISAFDSITLRHEATDRSLFAAGALDCSLWLAKKCKAGFYEMQDFAEIFLDRQ